MTDRFRMTPEEERACWATMMWKAAALGHDPSIVWGGARKLTDLFVSACLDLHDQDLLLRSVMRGDFVTARMSAYSVIRVFDADKWISE